MAGTALGSYQAAVSGVMAAQESYVRFAWGWIEQSQKQQEAFQALAEESFRFYTGLFYTAVPSPPSVSPDVSPDVSRNGGEEPELPIEDYDRLTVEEVVGNLGELNAVEVKQVKAHERQHKNRATLIERLDRSLV